MTQDEAIVAVAAYLARQGVIAAEDAEARARGILRLLGVLPSKSKGKHRQRLLRDLGEIIMKLDVGSKATAYRASRTIIYADAMVSLAGRKVTAMHDSYWECRYCGARSNEHPSIDQFAEPERHEQNCPIRRYLIVRGHHGD